MISVRVGRPFSVLLLTSIILGSLVPACALTTGMPAALVIGQADFTTQYGDTTQTNFVAPIHLAFDASGNLWVADQFNNRVLMFKPPFTNGKAASIVIGHGDFTSNGPATTQTGLSNPVDLGFDSSGNLWVVDSNNYRVLMFKPPFTNGKAASLVIGQDDYTHNDRAVSQTKLNGPQGLSFDSYGNLWISDCGGNRALMFEPPYATGMAAGLVVGQTDFTSSAVARVRTDFLNRMVWVLMLSATSGLPIMATTAS